MSRSSQRFVLVSQPVLGLIEIEGAEARVRDASDTGRESLLREIRGASGLISWISDRVDGEVLDAAGDGLRVVASYAVGHDNIDLEACRGRNVVVTNTPHAVTEGTANMAWALLLAVSRRVLAGDRHARSGRWAEQGALSPTDFVGQDLTGRTMLIVGAGRIGLATAMRAQAFGMRVAYVARSQHWEFELAPLGAERVSLDEGLARADVVSIHCPLTDQTRGLIGAEQIARMKPNAILINTARGAIVDEGALAEALQAGRIFGAGLDVFEREPRVHAGLVGLDNVVMTPHVGSAEDRFRREMTRMACESVSAVLNGREPAFRVV